MDAMDSKAINKLIRSEIWPILRKQGFTNFDARNAFAYDDHFINIVNFQSFNSYNAEVIGCTTYSFCLNLGVYVIGSPGEAQRTRDKGGLLSPREYECQFRTQLKKRSPIDHFEREEIFYIHPDGRTTAACLAEVRHLLEHEAPQWFAHRNDLDKILSLMLKSQNQLQCARLMKT